MPYCEAATLNFFTSAQHIGVELHFLVIAHEEAPHPWLGMDIDFLVTVLPLEVTDDSRAARIFRVDMPWTANRADPR